MNRSDLLIFQENDATESAGETAHWLAVECHSANFYADYREQASLTRLLPKRPEYGENWEQSVTSSVNNLVTMIVERKKQDLRFGFLESAIAAAERRIQLLESRQTRIVPIDTFAPEPYILLQPFRVSVQMTGEEFEAGWFDANINSSGINEEEAVTNLKSLILDFYDSLTKEKPENLASGTARQLAVLKTFIRKQA
jgi:hypothetical protein